MIKRPHKVEQIVLKAMAQSFDGYFSSMLSAKMHLKVYEVKCKKLKRVEISKSQR